MPVSPFSKRAIKYLIAILNCIRALGGYTQGKGVDNMFDTDDFVESEYLECIHQTSGNISMSLSWYADDQFSFFILDVHCCYAGTTRSRSVNMPCPAMFSSYFYSERLSVTFVLATSKRPQHLVSAFIKPGTLILSKQALSRKESSVLTSY